MTRHVRAAVRTIGLRNNSDFDVSTIGPDTDLEALGVDSLIVGDLHARLKKAFSLTLDMRSYTTLKTPRVRQLVSIRRSVVLTRLLRPPCLPCLLTQAVDRTLRRNSPTRCSNCTTRAETARKQARR